MLKAITNIKYKGKTIVQGTNIGKGDIEPKILKELQASGAIANIEKVVEVKEQQEKILQENADLEKENVGLKKENIALNKENVDLKKEVKY